MTSSRILLLLITLLFFMGVHGRSLEDIKRSGVIYVAFTSDDLSSIEYDLALEFARYLNVELREVKIEWDEAFMQNGSIPEDLMTNSKLSYTPDVLNRADIICSTFTVIEWRKRLFGFAHTLQSAELLIVDKEETVQDDFTELAGKRIAFMGATTFEQHLLEINSSLSEEMQLVRTATTAETMQLLEDNEVYGIVLDADEALNFIARSDQKYKIAFPISDITKSAWAVEKNNPLSQEVENFFETIAGNGFLDHVFYQRFGITYKSYLEGLNKNLRKERYHRDLDEILASRKLVVALRERDYVYHESGQKQFMHAMAEEFADYLGVSLEFVVTPNFLDYWKTKEGEIIRDSSYTPDWFKYFDLACETFAPLDWRTNKVNMIPVYPLTYVVVAKKEANIKTIDDLNNYLGVTGSGTVYEDELAEHGITNFYLGNVNNFISDVVEGKADYTILYNAFYELSAYPELERKLQLGSTNVCWGLRKDQPKLQEEVEKFIARAQTQGMIGSLMKALRGNSLQSPEEFLLRYYESFQIGQLPFVNYGADDGLPQEDIFSIFQDQKGYLWFGTNSGAVRFNGREMTIFNHEQGLPSNSVRDINQDSSGVLYFATTSGIAKFQGETTLVTMLDGISFNKIFVDSKDNPWYISDDGIYAEDQQGDLWLINEKYPLLPDIIYDITEDPGTGYLLMATIEGVFLFDQENGGIDQLSSTECHSLFIDSNDRIWMSSSESILIANTPELLENRSEAILHSLNERIQLPSGVISHITADKYGSIWLITDSRIMQVIDIDQDPIVYEQGIGIKNNEIRSFLIDREDNIWIGFSGGLQRLSYRKGLKNFFPGILDSYIYSIFQDTVNRLWITSNNGIFNFQNAQLVNLTPLTESGDKKFTGTLLPNQNILLANNEGLYELSSISLEIVNQNLFGPIAHGINNIFISSKGEIFLLTGTQGVIYYFRDFYSQPVKLKDKSTANIFQLIEFDDRIIGGNNTGFVIFDGSQFELFWQTDCNVWTLHKNGTDVWIGTDCGIGLVRNGHFDQVELSGFDREMVIKSILPARNKNYLWLGTSKGFSYFNTETQTFEFTINAMDGLSGDEITPGGLFIDSNDLLWVGTYHGISNFNIKARSLLKLAPVCYMEKMFLNGERVQTESGRAYSHKENSFIFEISALLYSNESSIEYEYYLRGTRNQFSSYYRGAAYRANYSNLPPGKYEFIYKAKAKNNIWSYAENYKFTIEKAWYTTWIFRIGVILLILALTYLIFSLRIRSIKANERRLDLLVRERTNELEVANAEIESQLEEIATQRDQILDQRDLVIKQKLSITDSIAYAQKIQSAILPSHTTIENFFREHFIIFQPRDIVSGDFYWFKETDDGMVLIGADCTGHGVPGAFMSMLGVTLLNELFIKDGLGEPGEMLGLLRLKVKDILAQEGNIEDQKDGMDMALVLIDREKKQLQFAGANYPLYLIRKKEHSNEAALEPYLTFENEHSQLYELKGDKQPIGVHWEETEFTNHVIMLKEQDSLYIFSDGIVDQFGGKDRKKYKAMNLRKLLLSIQGESMEQQKLMIESAFDSWRGKHEQIDDISVIGVRL